MYKRRQSGTTLVVLLLVSGAVPLLLLFLEAGADTPTVRLVASLTLGMLLICALVFSSLTIAVDADTLRWHFGPGYPRGSIPLQDIVSAVRTKTSLVQGIGIHRTRHGWLYNVSANEAVHLTLRGGRQLLLGTDEPEALIQAIHRAEVRSPGRI